MNLNDLTKPSPDQEQARSQRIRPVVNRVRSAATYTLPAPGRWM